MEINILLTSAGRRVPLTRAFQKALREDPEVSGKVVSVDMDPLSSGLYVSDKFYLVPHSKDPDYIPKLLEICKKDKIALLFPTTDIELEILSENKDLFQKECGTKVVVSDFNVIKICNDKIETFRFFKENKLPTPETFYPEEVPENIKFPLFLKPVKGRGSIDAYKAQNWEQLRHLLALVPDAIVQEYLDGPEYTIDVLCDFEGKVISVVPRERIATAAGVSQKGRTVKNPVLIDFAVKVTKSIPMIGPVNIQCCLTGEGPKCIEINPRFSGGIPLTLAAGADFPRFLIQLAAGKKPKTEIDEFKDNLIMLRYDESIYLDGDNCQLYIP